MKIATGFLLSSVLLTGFMGGIGFVNFIGFGPALRDTPAEHIVRYWQIVDSYMSVRMPVFGSAILLSFLGSGFFLVKQSNKQPLWLLILALAFIITDIVIATQFNFLFNRNILKCWKTLVLDILTLFDFITPFDLHLENLSRKKLNSMIVPYYIIRRKGR
jgi:hypothetical protein